MSELWKVGDLVNRATLNEKADELLPPRVIMMWHGQANTVPAGWAICDGTKGTPDLRDLFVVGAGKTYEVGSTGGEAKHALTEAEGPRHSHNMPVGLPVPSYVTGVGNVAGALANLTTTVKTASSGSGTPHNNIPPYYALYYIMRL